MECFSFYPFLRRFVQIMLPNQFWFAVSLEWISLFTALFDLSDFLPRICAIWRLRLFVFQWRTYGSILKAKHTLIIIGNSRYVGWDERDEPFYRFVLIRCVSSWYYNFRPHDVQPLSSMTCLPSLSDDTSQETACCLEIKQRCRSQVAYSDSEKWSTHIYVYYLYTHAIDFT